ncbi:MAG: hypothetical protein ACREX0_16345 [Noviherbaspirillum sp.]
MELMHSHRWEARVPDWIAAAVSGFVAGAVLMVLELIWSAIGDVSPWTTTNMIAAITMGSDVMQSNEFDFSVIMAALLTHYVLGTVYGMILAAIIAPFHFDSSPGLAMLIGAVFGLALYLLNFYGMVRFFPWFAEMRNWVTVWAHVIFGMTAAFMYWQLEKRESTS